MENFKPTSGPKVMKQTPTQLGQIDYGNIKEVVDAGRFTRSYENATKNGFRGDSATFAKQLISKGYEIEGFKDFEEEQKRGKYIQKINEEQKNFIEQAKQSKEKKSFLESIKTYAQGRSENVEKIYQRTGEGEQTLLEAPLQMAGEGIGFVSDIIGESMIRGAKGLYSLLPQYVKEGAEKKAKEIIKKPVVQKGLFYVTKGAEQYNKWAQSHPRADANIRSVYNIGEMLLNFKASKIVGETVQKGGKETLEAAGEVASLVTKPLAKGTEKLTTGVLGLTTGTSPDTIRTALKYAGTDDFTKALRGEITDINVLENVNKALVNLKNNRRTLYGEGYDKLIESTATVGLDDAVEGFTNKVFSKGGFGVKATDEGLDFTKSTISRGSGQENVIKNIASDIAQWKKDGDFSPASIDILKKRIGDYFQGSEGFAQTDMLVEDLTKKLSKSITDVVPEYAEMNAKYSELSNIIKEVSSTLSVGSNKNTTTAITKLIGSLRRNQEYRQVVLQSLEQFTDDKLLAQLAGTALSEAMPRGLAGVIAGGSAVVGGAFLSPQFLGGLALASPRIVGELANAVGVSVDFINKAIKNAQKITSTILQNPGTNVYPIDISSVFGGLQSDELDKPSIQDLLKTATDEELKANGFTATMIKQFRKKNPVLTTE